MTAPDPAALHAEVTALHAEVVALLDDLRDEALTAAVSPEWRNGTDAQFHFQCRWSPGGVLLLVGDDGLLRRQAVWAMAAADKRDTVWDLTALRDTDRHSERVVSRARGDVRSPRPTEAAS